MARKFILDKIANRTRIGFLAAFVLLLISNILTFISTQKVSEQAKWINQTNQIIHDLDNLLSFITRAESSFRGFVISDNQSQLSKFDNSVRQMDSTLHVIRLQTRDNPRQQKNLDTLDAMVQQALLSLEDRITVFESTHRITTELIEKSNMGNVLMFEIENFVHKIQEIERSLWNERAVKISEYSQLIRILNIISVLVAIILTLYSILVFNKENRAKREADEQAEQFRQQLETRVNQLAELNSELIELRGIEKYAVTGRIARTIAHEVRNPLTNINLAIEQLKTEFEGNESSDMFFDMVSRNSERINRLVSDLLDSTRTTELKLTKVSINDLLDECLAEAKDRLQLNHIKVIKNYDSDICEVNVDYTKMKIAFLNIIVNAIEAMEDGSELILTTSSLDGKCVVKIRDTGKGMSKDQLGRLFEPFFTTKQKGNGLGLANTHNIILSHNASIKAESEEGKGTTFTIVI